MKMKKRNLAVALREGLHNQGVHELEEAARQVGIPSSSLRNWLKRNAFPQKVLPSLAKLAGLPDDLAQLADRFEFRFARPKRGHVTALKIGAEERLGLVGIFYRFEAQTKPIERLQRRFGIEVRELFLALREGDVFFYLSLNLKPIEWENTGWMTVGDAVHQAVERGAFFIYCIPNENARKWAGRLGLRSVPGDWEEDWEQFRKNIEKGLGLGLKKRVEQYVHKIECDPSCFMMPEHKYALFICKNPRGTDPKSFVLLPTDTTNSAHLPLHSRFTNLLSDYLLKNVRAAESLPQDVKEAIIS